MPSNNNGGMPAQYWQLATQAPATTPAKPKTRPDQPQGSPGAVNQPPAQTYTYYDAQGKQYKATRAQANKKKADEAAAQQAAQQVTQGNIPPWLLNTVTAPVQAAVQAAVSNVNGWFNAPVPSPADPTPKRTPGQATMPAEYWQMATNGGQYYDANPLNHPIIYTTPGLQPPQAAAQPAQYWQLATQQPNTRPPANINQNTSMSYPGYTGPKGPDPYNSFNQLEPPPAGVPKPAASAVGKGKFPAKGNGWGRRGGGSSWVDYGSKDYPTSAWASLVGWNINR